MKKKIKDIEIPVNEDGGSGGETGTIPLDPTVPLLQRGKFSFEGITNTWQGTNMIAAWNMGYGRTLMLPADKILTTAEIIRIMDIYDVDPDPNSRQLGYTGYYAYPITNSLYPFPRTVLVPDF